MNWKHPITDRLELLGYDGWVIPSEFWREKFEKLETAQCSLRKAVREVTLETLDDCLARLEGYKNLLDEYGGESKAEPLSERHITETLVIGYLVNVFFGRFYFTAKEILSRMVKVREELARIDGLKGKVKKSYTVRDVPKELSSDMDEMMFKYVKFRERPWYAEL